jgi:ABC-type branched-subunit amino acid transport system substrate-binding protein
VKYEPDAVFIVGLEKPCQKMARVLRDEGFEGVFLGTDAIKPTKVLVTPGFSGLGPYLTNSGISAFHQAPEFHQRYESRFGPHHSVYTIEVYDAARMLIQLLRRSESGDRTEIHQLVLGENGYQGLGGRIRFDAQGERIEPEMGIYRFEGSELKFLGTQRTVFDS